MRLKKKAGMVLVIMLAMVVLVTVVVMAFFTQAMASQQTETSRVNGIKAALLARTAQDYTTGLFLKEVGDPSNSLASTVSEVKIYFPLNATNSVAQRVLSDSISKTDTSFANLIRQSVPKADANVSSDSTAAATRQGRQVGLTRWNSPQLLTGAGFGNTNQLPYWIYVTKTGGITNTPSRDVIGRFAYNVYEIGGLLNITSAGYPSVVTDLSGLKRSPAGADLLQLPGVNSQSAVDQLIEFRNHGATSATAYTNAVNAFLKNGYLTRAATNAKTSQVFTNNVFVSRQDLLRYVRTQNSSLTNALPYLTTFSRSVNAPSWMPPASPINSNFKIADVRFAESGSVNHYKDDGNPDDSYEVSRGEPLVQRRFSLAKLAWLTPLGPATGITEEAIQDCFGLRWDKDEERWNYVGPYGTAIQESIATLDQIATEPTPREPNFFEYLKAGILTGSLGAAAVGKSIGTQSVSFCAADNNTLDANKDLHVLRIGANIIDNADTDNYPTLVALSWGGLVVERAGVEDLPYFYSLDTANLRNITVDPIDYKKYTFNTSDFVIVPELFNPHRPTPSGDAPSGIRIQIMNGLLQNVGFGENGWLSNFKFRGTPNKDLSTLPVIDIPTGDWESFRNGPRPARQSSAANSLGVMIPGATDTDVLGFHLFSHTNPEDYPPGFPGVMSDALSKIAIVQMDGLIVSLRYKTPKGNWKTYQTFGGYESFADETGINGLYRDDFEFPMFKFSDSINNQKTIMSINSPTLAAYDPRSSRFGPALDRYRKPLGQAPQFKTTDSKTWVHTFGGPQLFYPNTMGINFAGNLPQKATFQDPDFEAATGPRPPDANLGFSGSGSTSTAANPYGSLGDTTRRPLILQRPYRNVAELGYVFRDTPWQTLNFWNNRSADGALLDLFSVSDEPAVSAARVTLATRQKPVLQALLSGMSQEYDGTLPLSATQVSSLATALNAQAYNTGEVAATVPANAADLAPFMSSTGVNGAGLSNIKYRREAAVRAFAGATQTRTWNLLLDIVAQAGRFSSTGVSPEDFVVEGESRTWVSTAIDRYTGKVIEQATEQVHE